MKLITLAFIIVGFAWNAHSAVELENSRYPLVRCTSERGLVVNVYNLENQKTAQLVVHNITNGPVVVANEVVRPIDGADAQLFISANASLRVVAGEGGQKGFLNLHRNQPSVGQPLECETYAHVLSGDVIPSL